MSSRQLPHINKGTVHNTGNEDAELTFSGAPAVTIHGGDVSRPVSGLLDQIRYNNWRYNYINYEGDVPNLPDLNWVLTFSGPGGTQATLQTGNYWIKYAVSDSD